MQITCTNFRQITTPVSITPFFIGQMLFLTPNQQCQSTEGNWLVVKFCYLGDMLSVDGDADAAVGNRIRIGWNKFSYCSQLYTVSQKKLGHFYFYYNFGKCWSILKILLLLESEGSS